MRSRIDRRGESARTPGRPASDHRIARVLRHYLQLHAQNLLAALGRLAGQPVSSAMTVAVIGIALALPASLYLLVVNGRAVSGGWEGIADISVYLKQDVKRERARALAGEIERYDGVAAVQHVPADEALAEFRRYSGFGDALDALTENPLPELLIVRPAADNADPQALKTLSERLRGLAESDVVQVDTQWVSRFNAILDTVRRLVVLAGSLFSLGVLVIVGNTIRLDIQNRRTEIEVTKLVGASDAFIRRPFLYGGVWYGLLGGLFALLCTEVGLWLLAGPAARIAGLYGSDFALRGLGSGPAALVPLGGALLGWLGSWLAATRHMRRIEPGQEQ